MRPMKRLATMIALLAVLGQTAQAATYYYYRGGAQATQSSGTKPVSPAPAGTFAILVDAPQIAIRGQGYSATTYAYSNSGQVAFSIASGTLPAGIGINAVTGTISGTPTAVGTSSVVIKGVDSGTGASATTSLTIEVDDPFSISGTPAASVMKGAPYSATFSLAGGGQPYSFSAGTMPPGLAFSAGATTASVAGVPTTTGAYNIGVGAVDSHGLEVLYPYTLQVYDVLAISGSPPASATVGVPYSGQLNVAGGLQPFTFSIAAGTLPTGVTLKSGTGVISGTPSSAGTKSGIKVKVVDAAGQSATSGAFAITVAAAGTQQPLTISGNPPTTGREGVAYFAQFNAGGGSGSYTYSLVGTLPAGLSFNPTTGLITGSPTVGSAGTYSGLTVRATDTASNQATSAAFTLTIAGAQAAITISGSPASSVQVNTPYAAQFTGAGGTGAGYVFALGAGTLPAGLSISPGGMLSGTPTAIGTSSGIKIRVTDNGGNTALTSAFSIAVSAPPALKISGTPAATASQGNSYSATWTAFDGSGSGYHFTSVGSALPPGLSLSDVNGAQGLLSGVATTPGTFSGLAVRVTDSFGNTATTPTFSISVSSNLAIFGSPASSTELGDAYAAQFTATGGSGGYVFTSIGTALPDGLSLSSSGLLSGSPTVPGTYAGLQVRVTDSFGTQVASAPFVIAVGTPPPPPPPQDALSILGTPADAVYGQAYSVSFTAGGGAPPYSYSLTGVLPGGLSFDTSTGTIAGTPAQIGSFSGLQVTVTDSAAATASTSTFSITVTDPNPLTISWTPQTNWQVGDFVAISPDVVGGDAGNYQFSIVGTAPSGLSLFSNGTLFGNLDTAGSFGPFGIQVTDGVRTATTNAVTFNVAAPGLFVSGFPAANADENQAYSAQFSAQGGSGTGYVFSMNGTLPSGLSLDPATGLISGTPAIGSAGTYSNLSVHVVDAAADNADSAVFSITVNALPPLTVVGSPPNTSTLGGSYSTVFSATGGTSTGYSFSLGAGSLPSGLSLASDGTLSGSPTVTGTFSGIQVMVTDSAAQTALSNAFSIQVVDDNPLTISWNPTTVYQIGDAVSISVVPSGGNAPSYVFGTTGTLPTGLSQNAGSGAITGTVTAGGAFGPVTVTVTDGLRNAATTPATFTVNGAIQISGSPAANGAVGQSYSAQFSSTGGTGTGLVYSSTGSGLPTGLTLNASTGLLSGTPTVAGTYSGLVIRVADDANHTASTAPFSIAIADVLALNSSTPAGTAGSSYSGSFTAAGGRAPFSYAVTIGSLPAGLNLNASTGALTGTPTLAESQTFTVTVTDANANTATKQATVTINAATASATLATASSVRSGAAIGGTLASSLPSPTWSFASTPASPSLGLSGSAGAFAGTAPTVASATPYSVTATASANGVTADAAPFALTVLPPLAISDTPTGTISGSPGNALATTAAPTVTGGQGALSYALLQSGSPVSIGSSCPGLSFSTSTGQLSGTPTGACSVGPLTIRVTDAADGATATSAQSFTVDVSAGTAVAALTSPSTVHAGAAVAGTLATSFGTPTWTFPSTPASPALTLVDNGDGTFSGTAPAVGASTTYTVTAHVSSAGAEKDATSFTLTVKPALAISGGPAGTVVGTIGTAVSLAAPSTTNAIGTPTFALLQGGSPADLSALCTGLSLNAAGAVSGTPSGSCNITDLTIEATDSADGSKAATSSPFALSMAPAVAISGTPTVADQGQAYSFDLATLTSGGRGSYTFAMTSGTLPAGMSLAGSIVSATSVTGTTQSVSIRATDADGRNVTKSLTFAVNAATASAALTSSSTVRQGSAISGTLATSESAPVWSFGVSPASPSLGLSASGATFSGTAPTVASSTVFTVTATATQGGVPAVASPFTVTVKPPLAIAGGPSGTVLGVPGQSFASASPTVSNGIGSISYVLLQGGSAYAALATDCPGLVLNGATGAISGTPAGACYVADLTLQATDAADASSVATAVPFALAVAPAVAISGTPTTANQGEAYSFDLATLTSGGRGAYAFSIVSGALPSGMSLSGSTVSASSVVGPTATVSVKATDADGRNATQPLIFTVVGATASAALTSPSTVHPGAAIAGTLATSYGTPVWSFGQTPVSPSLALSASGATFSGTAPSVGSQTSFSIVATATQGGTHVDAAAVSVIVKPALSISGGPSGTAAGTTGQSFSTAAPSASNAIGAVSYALLQGGSPADISTLCTGLTFSTASGALGGAASAPCSVSGLTIRATDAFDATTATTATPFAVVVTDPPVTLTGTPGSATYGQAYSYQMNAAGGSGTGYVFSLASGALPNGLSLSAAGLISGTPTDLTGTSGIVIHVVDSRGGSKDSAPLAISVVDPSPLTISWNPTTSFVGGQTVSLPVSPVGGAPGSYAFTVAGTPISGLTVDPATGTLSGTLPTAAGSYGPIGITVADGLRTATTALKAFTVAGPTASLARTSGAVARTGAAISGTLSTNIPSPTWSFGTTPNSPALGLTAPTSSTFSGTAPSVASPTAYSIVATAINGASTASSAAANVTVAPAFAVAGGPSADVTGLTGTAIATTPAVTFGTTAVGTPSFQVLTASSTVFDVATSCGLTLNGSGQITGTPTKACSASGLTVRATDSDGATASTATPFAINIILAPAAPSTSYPAIAVLGGAYAGPAPTAVGGTGPYTWAVATGSLPNGISMNASTGALSGTPTLNGTYTFTIRSTDAASRVSPNSAAITVTVTSTPTPTGSVTASAIAGTAYSSSGLVAGSGGQLPYVWSIASGNLPPGLALNASNGTISGTPTDIGTFTFAVRLTDAVGNPGTPTANFSIAVSGVAAPSGQGGTCGGTPWWYSNQPMALPGTGTGTPSVDFCWGYAFHGGGLAPALANINTTYLNMTTPSTVTNPPSAAQLSVSCNGPTLFTYNSLTVKQCTISSAPVVTPQFLSQLSAGGFQYVIVYPQTDSGNGRALVMWTSGPSYNSHYDPVYQGIARITGMQFQGQYSSKTYLGANAGEFGEPIANGNNFTLPYDDSAGQFIANLGATAQATTARGYLQVPGAGIEASAPTTYAFVVQDAWLNQTATPAPSGSYAAATVGSSYSSQITGTGTWAVTSGSLPPGLSLNSATGVVSGTPTGTGTYAFSVKVTANQIASSSFATSIMVNPATVTTNVAQSHVRQGQTVTGSLSTSLTGASWTVASSPAATWTVTGTTFSGTAPPVASTTAMSVTGTASISGYSQAGTSAGVTVHPAVSITSMPNVAGNAGTAASSTPAVADLLGTPTYSLLQNGSAVSGNNIGALCAGLSFSATTGAVSGTPTTACNVTGLQTRVVDAYDGSTGTSPTWSVAVVFNANNVFTSNGSYTVLPYNTITIRVWGGSGASGGILISGSPSFTAPVAGGNGGASTLTGAGISINAPGGLGATGYPGGGASAAGSGGNSVNAAGTAGGSGSSNISGGGSPTALTPAAGGTAPGTGGGTGAAPGANSGTVGVKGVTGNAPGGGSSGATYQMVQSAGGNILYPWWRAGGGGSGAFVQSTWTAGQSGAPSVGSTLSFTVGAGGTIGSGASASTVGAAGAPGRVQIIIQ